MRDVTRSTERYIAGQVPVNADAISQFLTTELIKIETALNLQADGFLEMITVAPTRPQEGMIRFAAATVLGAAQGFYGYNGGAWRRLD